jgi:hypothetical protein
MLQMFHLDVSNVDLSVAHVAMTIHTCCNRYTRMFQVFHRFQTYVANVYSGCFKSRYGIAHVAMAIHACLKHMFQVFHLFQTYVVNVFI